MTVCFELGDKTMTVTEFSRLLEVYGADLRRWPSSVREAGLALAASEPAAQAVLTEEKALDAILAEAPRGTVSKALEDSIIAQFEAQRPQVKRGLLGTLWPQGPAWVPVSAFAASLLLGVMCASFVPGISGSGQDELAALSAVNLFGPTSEDGLIPASGAM